MNGFRKKFLLSYLLVVLVMISGLSIFLLILSNKRLEKSCFEKDEEIGHLLYEKVRLGEMTATRLAEMNETEQRVRNLLSGKEENPGKETNSSKKEDDSSKVDSVGIAKEPDGAGKPGMFTLPVVWPLERGWVTRKYNPARGHFGVDIATKSGAPVFSTGDGVVKDVYDDEILGKTVVISHWGGVETLYAHNSKILVTKGEPVMQHQVIALAGSTGKSVAPHLHFEVIIDGKHINPMIHLERKD